MSLAGRIRVALLASLLGWVAALITSIPFQIVETVRNAGGDGRMLAYELVMVLAMWSVLTFVMAVYWCGFFLIPVVWLFSAGWVLRHRQLWLCVTPAFGVVLMAARLHVWTAFQHDGISVINFFMWAVYAAAFFGSTAVFYSRFLRSASEIPA